MLLTDTVAQPNTTKERGRKWLYPAVRKGQFYQYRSWLSYFYLILFFAGPLIRINGHPLLLFNIIDRRFVLLGQVFWPQDFFIFVLATLAGVVCIVLFTIAFGRIFCGWICPQTIFMEMVFRKIEFWLDGDAQAAAPDRARQARELLYEGGVARFIPPSSCARRFERGA